MSPILWNSALIGNTFHINKNHALQLRAEILFPTSLPLPFQLRRAHLHNKPASPKRVPPRPHLPSARPRRQSPRQQSQIRCIATHQNPEDDGVRRRNGQHPPESKGTR